MDIFVYFSKMGFAQELAREIMAKLARQEHIDRNMNEVARLNAEEAKRLGMSLKDYHEYMSKKGNAVPEVIVYQSTETNQDDIEIAKASTRWIGGYHAKNLKGFRFIKKK